MMSESSSLSNQDNTVFRTGVVGPDYPEVKDFLEKIRNEDSDTYQYLITRWDQVRWVAIAMPPADEKGEIFALAAISTHNEVGLPLPTFTAVWTTPQQRRRGFASYLMKLASNEVFSHHAARETIFVAQNEADLHLFCKAADKGAPIVMKWVRSPSG
jgi:GNAT superfamily N-acetyltransferase